MTNAPMPGMSFIMNVTDIFSKLTESILRQIINVTFLCGHSELHSLPVYYPAKTKHKFEPKSFNLHPYIYDTCIYP